MDEELYKVADRLKMELIKKIRQVREDFRELYDLGVIGVSPHTPAVQLTSDLFFSLAGEKYKIEERISQDYPYYLHATVNGLRIFTILTKEEFEEVEQNG